MNSDNPGLAIGYRKWRNSDKPPQCLDVNVVLLVVDLRVHEALGVHNVNQVDMNPCMLAIMRGGSAREYM